MTEIQRKKKHNALIALDALTHVSQPIKALKMYYRKAKRKTTKWNENDEMGSSSVAQNDSQAFFERRNVVFVVYKLVTVRLFTETAMQIVKDTSDREHFIASFAI